MHFFTKQRFLEPMLRNIRSPIFHNLIFHLSTTTSVSYCYLVHRLSKIQYINSYESVKWNPFHDIHTIGKYWNRCSFFILSSHKLNTPSWKQHASHTWSRSYIRLRFTIKENSSSHFRASGKYVNFQTVSKFEYFFVHILEVCITNSLKMIN